jgi:hypothetical protein
VRREAFRPVPSSSGSGAALTRAPSGASSDDRFNLRAIVRDYRTQARRSGAASTPGVTTFSGTTVRCSPSSSLSALAAELRRTLGELATAIGSGSEWSGAPRPADVFREYETGPAGHRRTKRLAARTMGDQRGAQGSRPR